MQSLLAQLGWISLALSAALCVGRAEADQPHRLPPVAWTTVPEPANWPEMELGGLVTASPNGGDVDAISIRPNFAELMRPTVSLAAEWQPEAGDVGMMWSQATLQMPTYPIFGPPPPMISGGLGYYRISAPDALDLPSELYDYSLGVSWVRPVSETWTLRVMASTALATDGHNTTSDSWQFRGGLFAMYRPNEQWTWIMGALALGRNDLPVVPAVGAIWQPEPWLRFDLTFPRPRANYLLVDNGPRQQWGYLGAGFEGGTWGIERAGGLDDQLTYRNWRVYLGWESIPTPEPGMPFARGRKLSAEIGYVFAREFEFESGIPSLGIDDTLMLRVTAGF